MQHTTELPSGTVTFLFTDIEGSTALWDRSPDAMADALAEAAIRDVGADAAPEQIAERIFRRLLVRRPAAEELAGILAFYQRQSTQNKPWSLVARALMNTDEAITTP